MMNRPFVLLVLGILACCAISSFPSISAATSDTTTSQIRNFRYVQINIIDTSNTTTNTFLPQLNGTVINLAENDMCFTPVFAAACNRTNNVDLLLRSTGTGTGTTKDISVLSIFQCISIWGPSRCSYDDGYTLVTYNQPQSSRPDTYTVHVLTQHFGCPCSRLIPNNTNTVPKSVTITSILLAPTFDFITVRFSAPIAASQLYINTSVPLNTLLTSAGAARLGTGATARWIDNTTLVFTLGNRPSLTDDLGLLPSIFAVVNYPDVSVSTYPRITTVDGFPIRFDVFVRDEAHPDVFCNNIEFTIVGLWSKNRSDISLQITRGNTPFTNFTYTLTPGNNTDITLLTLSSTTWRDVGTYFIDLAVPSRVFGTRRYNRTIDVWRTGACECTSARPEYYECRDCANPATPCLNNGTCVLNPALNTTSMSPANATSRSTCTNCRNGYFGVACQFPPPCGLTNTSAAIAAVCGPHGVACTNSADAIPVAICTCEQDWSGTKCTIMSEAWTYVTLRLLYNYSSITNTTQFSNAFANEMGTALKRNPALFVVKSLRPGSTIVEFGIQPDRNNSVPSRAIYNQFFTLFSSNSTNFTGPILSTLDRSFSPIVIYDCNADGCTSAVPASGASTDDDDWKLGVGLGVGLGGACLLLTCLFLLCRRRPEDTTTRGKEVDYPSSVPMTTPAPVAAAAPIPVTTIKQVDVPAETHHDTHDEEKATAEQTEGAGEKRTVVFHV